MTLPTAPARLRRTTVGLAVAGVLVVAAAGGSSLVAQLTGGHFEQTSILAPQGQTLSVRAGSGDVAVFPSTDGAVHVTTRVSYRGERPRLVEEATDSGVRLAHTCDPVAGGCEVDYTVSVPADFALDLQTLSGEVVVTGVDGPVVAHVYSGDVRVADAHGDLDLTAVSGDVVGDRLTAPTVTARSSSGGVWLDFDVSPHDVVVEVADGEIDVAVPGPGPYDVQTSTSSGDERISVAVDPRSDRVIRVDTVSGDVTVRDTEPPEPPEPPIPAVPPR